ncbi:MAG: phosphatase PAP2 family protein [Ignavibacteria bacterium]|nr:phosphatase PAP2 family protein [Ignavibacteria bacterium]
MEFLYSIDVAVFRFINSTLANPLTDKLMPFITDVRNWYLLYIFLWFLILFKGGRYRVGLAIGMILLVVVSDQLSSVLLKSLFARPRPCKVLENVHLLVGCTDSYSFPSSHAVNNFAAAMFFTYFYRHLKWILFSVASVMALSRIFVGVHYPSDVLGGALIGMGIGYLMAVIYNFILVNIYSLKIFGLKSNTPKGD